MKVTIEENKKTASNEPIKQEKYPCLKVHEDGTVIFFTSKGKGVCLKAVNSDSAVNFDSPNLLEGMPELLLEGMPELLKAIFRAHMTKTGMYSKGWRESSFKKFDGDFSLSNTDLPLGDAEYPKLKISKKNSAVVFFIDDNTGICLKNGNPKPFGLNESLGDYYDCWEESNFEIFNGTIILAND